MTTHPTTLAHDSTAPNARPFSRHLPVVARVLLGLVFLASGVFGLLIAAGVVPVPQPSPPAPERAAAFLAALAGTGYLFPLIKGTETVAGALLISNRFVPLALALLAPVLVNIVAFHVFLSPAGIAPGVVLAVLEVYLAWANREAYRPLLAKRTTPCAP